MTLRDDLTRLAERGPHRDPRQVIAHSVEASELTEPKQAIMALAINLDSDAGPRRVAHPRLISAAAVIALALGLVAFVGTRDGADPVVSPAATGLTPVETLPPSDDLATAPMSVPDASFRWYRLAPDLDLAWNTSPADGPQLCWRTPADQACVPDVTAPNERVIAFPTAGGQMLVLVWSIDARRNPTHAFITLSDGARRQAPVTWGKGVGIGYARFDHGGGAQVVGVETGPPPN